MHKYLRLPVAFVSLISRSSDLVQNDFPCHCYILADYCVICMISLIYFVSYNLKAYAFGLNDVLA